jgi:hypothetical protein
LQVTNRLVQPLDLLLIGEIPFFSAETSIVMCCVFPSPLSLPGRCWNRGVHAEKQNPENWDKTKLEQEEG